MPKGLTRNSSPIQVSSSIQESAPNTFTSLEVDLTLNALDQEVFVVTQVNIDLSAPDMATTNDIGGRSNVRCTVSSTARTTIGSIADSNIIAQSKKEIQSLVVVDPSTVPPTYQVAGYVAFDREDPLFAAMDEDYIGIIATSNMHLNILGEGNASTKGASVRVYGYRAKMDSAGYAALVQSQVLSA